MTDFHTLTDAFAELERRADAASASLPADTAHHVPVRHRTGLLLVAASVVAVLAVVAATALLARSRTGGTSGTEAAAEPTIAATHPATTSGKSVAPKTFQVPRTPAELTRRFRGGTRRCRDVHGYRHRRAGADEPSGCARLRPRNHVPGVPDAQRSRCAQRSRRVTRPQPAPGRRSGPRSSAR